MKQQQRPIPQTIAYAQANMRSTLSSWFDLLAAALVFYIFT